MKRNNVRREGDFIVIHAPSAEELMDEFATALSDVEKLYHPDLEIFIGPLTKPTSTETTTDPIGFDAP